MKRADLTRKQREELEKREEVANWVEAGFREYADMCRQRGEEWAAIGEKNTRILLKVYNYTELQPPDFYRGNIHRDVGTQLDKCAKEFGRILRGEVAMSDEDDPSALRNDLCGLMKRGCPAVALVELMFAGTSDYGATISDILAGADPLYGYLRRISENLEFWRVPRRPRRFKDPVPLSIQFVLESAPFNAPKNSRRPSTRVAFHLAYFYMLLKHFKYSHKTLRCLLRTMRYVRRRVPPVADYLKIKGSDSFTESSLQRRVLRFYESHPGIKRAMRKDILEYLSARVEARKTPLGIF